ncbi:hypothetical protein EDB83DRAFT_2642345 [Lactarius deliciosus]|nr:hypothetical protein EDB83DRAFT_2642345 [Lactarius deliciosus]
MHQQSHLSLRDAGSLTDEQIQHNAGEGGEERVLKDAMTSNVHSGNFENLGACKHTQSLTAGAVKLQPYVSIQRWPASLLAEYQPVGSRQMPVLVASGHNTSLPSTQTLSKVHAKGVRVLDKPFSWDDIMSWDSNNCPELPSGLRALFGVCDDQRSTSTAPHTCQCPEAFRLQWYEEVGCLLCMQHMKLIPGDYVWKHLSRFHPQKYTGVFRATVFKAALSHIVGCYPQIKNQTTIDVKNSLPMQLSTPLPLACELVMRYKCPVTGCPQWTHQNKGRGAPEAEHNRHLKTHSTQELASCRLAVAQPTQMVDIGAGRTKANELTGKTHCFTFPIPSQTQSLLATPRQSLFPVDHVTPSTQNWAVSLGWEDYIATLAHQLGGHQKAVTKLRDLVTLPSKRRLEQTTNTVMKTLERGLLLSNSLNQTYMKDGVKWVDDKHHLIRARFSHNMKKPFRQFANDNNYTKYRRSLISIESFLLRSLVDELMNARTAILVYHSKDTMSATKGLLELILASEGGPDLDELMSKKHTLYLSILRAGIESEDKVGCPIDQVLIARSLSAQGKWRKASLGLVEDSARFQDQEGDSSSESGTSDDEGTSSSKSGNSDTDSDSGGHEVCFNPCVVTDWDIESALHSLHNKLEMPSQVNGDAEESYALPTINEVLDKYLDLIAPSKQVGFITPFQRIVNVSSILYKDSAHKPSFHASFREGNITLTNHVDTPIILPLTKICTVVHRATTDFVSKVEAALLPGATIKGFPLHLLSDDFSSTPLHKQPANSEILQPLLVDYWNQVLAGRPCHEPLYGDTGLNRIEADKWLADYDACFPQAACAITLNTGGIDGTTFRHHHYAGPDRTVFLLKNGTVAFVNPIHSHRKISRRLDFVTVPPDISHCFLALIVVLLPIAKRLRHLKGQINPLHSTCLWISPRRRTTGRDKWGYDSNTANSTLTPLTQEVLGVSLTGKAVCKIIWQLLTAEFPLLVHNFMLLRSPVDDLAQHQYATGLRAYGRLTHLPSFDHLTSEKAIRGQTFCEIWQALTKCGPINDMWKSLVIGSAIFPIEYFPGLALRVARKLILSNYGIQMGHSPQGRKKLVEKLLETKPFLHGINNNGTSIGDQVLLSVLHTFIFGSTSTQSKQNVTITELIFSESASLIITALFEWSTGSFVDLSRPNSTTAEHLECLRAQITTKLVENRIRKSSLRVANLHARSYPCLPGTKVGVVLLRTVEQTQRASVLARGACQVEKQVHHQQPWNANVHVSPSVGLASTSKPVVTEKGHISGSLLFTGFADSCQVSYAASGFVIDGLTHIPSTQTRTHVPSPLDNWATPPSIVIASGKTQMSLCLRHDPLGWDAVKTPLRRTAGAGHKIYTADNWQALSSDDGLHQQ